MSPKVDYPQKTHPERLLVVEKLGDYKGKKILDIGCGEHKSIPEAIGIDILPITDVCCYGNNLPYEDKTVDAIISRHSLEHFLDTVKTLIEWKRVLKCGGKMIIVLPDHQRTDTMAIAMNDGSHLHAFTVKSFENLIKLIPSLRIIETGLGIKGWSFYVVLEREE